MASEQFEKDVLETLSTIKTGEIERWLEKTSQQLGDIKKEIQGLRKDVQDLGK